LGESPLSAISLRKLDLNLLTVFEAVYEERSQQKASERLYMSQPAISNAISRLRHLVNDRLFFGSRSIQATPKADELYVQVHQALDLIRAEFFAKEAFDPGSTRRTFTIAIAYGSGYLIGGAIFKRLQAEAPHARMVISHIDPLSEIPQLLREQKIDVAITKSNIVDPMLDVEFCLDFKIAVAVRKGHPRITHDPTIEELLQENYLWVHDSTHESEVAEFQEFIRKAEEATQLEVPSAPMVPVLLSQTDLVALMPRSFIERMKDCYPIEAYELPFKQISNHSVLTWHRAFGQDPAINWFRTLCSEVIEGFRDGNVEM
jgi:LysR family transcriptional regulator, transcriptional activator for leuABCD operon